MISKKRDETCFFSFTANDGCHTTVSGLHAYQGDTRKMYQASLTSKNSPLWTEIQKIEIFLKLPGRQKTILLAICVYLAWKTCYSVSVTRRIHSKGRWTNFRHAWIKKQQLGCVLH